MKYVKKRTSDYLKPLGLIPNSVKSLWVDDNGFYLTYVELAPWNGFGVYINVAVQFLWNNISVNAFQYYETNSAIIVPETAVLGGCIMFEHNGWQNTLEMSLSKAVEQVTKYRMLKDYSQLCNQLKNRNDLFATQFADYVYRDTDRAVALALDKRTNEALEIFDYVSQTEQGKYYAEAHRAVIEGRITDYVRETITKQRLLFSKKWPRLKESPWL
jgi:hypothetical protein